MKWIWPHLVVIFFLKIHCTSWIPMDVGSGLDIMCLQGSPFWILLSEKTCWAAFRKKILPRRLTISEPEVMMVSKFGISSQNGTHFQLNHVSFPGCKIQSLWESWLFYLFLFFVLYNLRDIFPGQFITTEPPRSPPFWWIQNGLKFRLRIYFINCPDGILAILLVTLSKHSIHKVCFNTPNWNTHPKPSPTGYESGFLS